MKRLLFILSLLFAAPAFAQTTPGNRGTVNSSAIIAVGNTFQTVLASNPRKLSLTIQNNNAADSCWIVVGGVLGSATKGIAILLSAGGSYTRYYPYIPSDAIHATCASANDTLYIDLQ